MKTEQELIDALKAFVEIHGKEDILGQLEDILGTEWMLEKLWDWDFDGKMEEWMIKKLGVGEFLDVRDSK